MRNDYNCSIFIPELGDAMAPYNGKLFSTWDVDNDLIPGMNCAEKLQGGWWFHNCFTANLNSNTNLQWGWLGDISQTTVMIRRSLFPVG